MVVYVRHGTTSSNRGGKDERLRGWDATPLTMAGIRQAHEAATRLPAGTFASFTSSDIPRAAHTARIIGDVIQRAPVEDAHLRTWNLGDLEGQKVSDVLEALRALIAKPQTRAPHGEAMNTYLARFVPTMRALVHSPGVHLVVGHGRGTTVIQGIADPQGGVGGAINPERLFQKPDVHPGGILTIDAHWHTTIDNPPGEPRLGDSQPSLGGLKKAG